ncbi:MAG: hypothetical protein Q9162_003236 [Coniocarpon cinnabarinum]
MAEASGLVIGALSLASLCSTCIQAFDTFEAGRNYQRDFVRAFTKFGLLRERLRHWGIGLNFEIQDCTYRPQRRSLKGDEDSVSTSLSGIKETCNDILALVHRHRLVSASKSQALPSISETEEAALQLLSVVPKRLGISPRYSLRKRTLWAIRDKHRFEVLILNLQFLIDNLERVRDPFGMSSSGKGTKGSLTSGQQTVPVFKDETTEDDTVLVSIDRHPSVTDKKPRLQDAVQQVPQTGKDQRKLCTKRSEAFLEEHTFDSKETIVTGPQKNQKGGIGMQGLMGDAPGVTRVTGPQTNTDFGFGLQGSTTAEELKEFRRS